MKKIIFTFTLALLLLEMMNTISVYAEELKPSTQKVEVDINEKNFPNEYVRYIVKEKIDKNNDNILQETEINNVTKLSITAQEDSNEGLGGFKEDVYTVIDCKGLEYFTNLNELYIYVDWKTSQSGLKNFNKVYKLKNLTKLTIYGDAKVKKWRFDKLPNLKELSMTTVFQIKKIRFGRNIEKLTMQYVGGTANVNLSKVKKLKKFSARDYALKKIKFGTNKKLRRIDIWSSSGNVNKTIQSLDVSGLKNLRYLDLTGLKNLKQLKFGKNTKLKRVWIIAGEKFKTIDFKECRISKVICLNKGVKVKNLWGGYKGLLQFL